MGRKSNDIIQGQSPAEEERNVALEETNQKEYSSDSITASIKSALVEKAEPLVTIDFTLENYNSLFPRGIVQTPIETVKLGENQFEKLDANNRNRFLLATYQTLAMPDIVIDENRNGSHSHNYIKSFIFDEKTKAVQDIVVSIDGENVSITAHPRDINNIVNKIKTPDQLVYAAAEVGRMIEQRTQYAQSIVNPTRVDRLSTISVPLNKEYSRETALSTIKEISEKTIFSKERNVALEETNIQGDKIMPEKENELYVSEEQALRIQLAREIKQNMPNLSDGERAAAIAILEAGASSQKMSLTDYVQKTFPNGVFGDYNRAQNAAHQQGVEINGAVSVSGFGANARAVIYASKTADFSTWCHELSHIWQAQLTGTLKDDAEKAFQVQDGNWQESIYTFADGHTDTSAEAFAYGFEDFLKHKAGEMATEDKKAIFEKFADYMSRTYNGIKQNIEVSEEIAKVYEKFVQLDDNILAEAEKAVRMEIEATGTFDKINSIFFEPNTGDTEERSDSILNGEPVYSVNTADFVINDGEKYKIAARRYIQEHPQGTAHTNIGDIDINQSSLDHSFEHSTYEDKIHVIPALKTVLESGTYLGVMKDADGKRINNHYFAAPVKIDEETKIVFIRVRETAGDKSRFYIHDVFTSDEIEKVNSYSGIPVTLRTKTGADLYKSIIQDYEKNNIIQNNPILFQAAYHGSGASFDRFNTAQYGFSGEGSMPFGWGTYLTSSEDIAKHYAKGYLYSVEIPDGKFLEWDKKVPGITKTEISEKLYAHIVESDPEAYSGNAANYLKDELASLFESEMNGQHFYGTLADYLGSEKQASEFLKESGYTGISYPAGTINGNGNDATNYVIFNDDDITIKEHLQFQLVGERSIMRMTQNEERKRILEDLAAAKLMDEKYSNIEPSLKATRIRFATGWEKSADGQWKYELDDSLNRIKSGSLFEKILNTSPEMLEQLTKNTTLTLDDIMEAPELYGVFPFMKNVRVGFYSDPNAFRAVLTPDGIKINTKYLDGISGEKGMKGVLAHEIQHIIQAVEYSGSKGINGESIEQLYNNMMEAMKAASIKRYDYDVSSLEHGLSEYMHDSGEIEARNVARRIFMNASERRHTTLESTEDIARNMQFQIIGEQGAGELDRNTESNERIANLDTAKEMEKAEKDANAIRLATGWEKGADGKWKYEIDDSKVHFDLYSAMEEWDNEHTRYKELQKKFFETGLSDEEQEEFDKWIDERNYVQDKHTDLSFAEKLFGKNFRLPEVMNHPELFKAYPELKDVTVSIKEQNSPAKGDANYEDKHINLYRAKEDTGSFEDWEKEAGSVLLHEVQHIIQGIEGFAKGADLDTFTPGIEAPELTKALSGFRTYSKEKLKNFSAAKEYQQYKDLGLSDDEIKELRPNIYGLGTIEEIIERDIKDHGVDWVYDEIQSAAEVVDNEGIIKVNGKKYVNNFDAYRSAAGEVESRNVQTRQHFTQEQRINTLLAATEDVSRDEQIVQQAGKNNTSLFIPDEKEYRSYQKQLDDYLVGNLKPSDFISLGKTPPVLEKIGVNQNEVVIFQNVIDKALRQPQTDENGRFVQGHEIDVSVLEKLPEYISNPLMVFKSDTVPNSKVIMTEYQDVNDRTVVVALHCDSRADSGKLVVNRISSVYRKDSDFFFLNQIRKGNLEYIDEKRSQEWAVRQRLQLPPLTDILGYNQNIITKEDFVNSHTEVEQRNIAPETSEERNMMELKTYHTLKEEDVKNLEIISDKDFSNIVDSIILNDYKNIPNTIRLPNINSELAEKLGLEKDSAFIMKKSAAHIRPDGKGNYGQAFDTEEYRMIPKVLREANFAVSDNVFKNFQIVFDDENNPEKINKLIFNKDELGNYLVTIGKVDRESAFSEERNAVVAVGVAPTIQTLRTRASSTALRASATTVNSNIAQNKEKSTEKQTLPPYVKTLNSLIDQAVKEEKISVGKTQDGETKQKKQTPPNLTKKGASDFLRAVQEGTAPFFNMQNDDFGKITMTPQLIVNAQTGLPFKDETQLLAQIYSAEQDMNGQIVTSMEGAKEAGTYIKKCDEAMKNFVLVNQQHLTGENKVMPTRYFSPEAAENPDMVYANVLHKNRPAKIKSFRKLCLHFERIPEGQKDIQVILTKIAWEHLKELQRELKLPDGWKTENLTEKDIIEKKEYIKNYFEKVPARERTVFQETFGICTDVKKEYGDPAFSDKTRKIMDDKLTQFIKDNSFSAEYLAAFTKEEYDKLEDWKKEKGRQNKIEAVGIKEPEVYLGRYLAACNSHAEFITDAETIKVIKEKLSTKLKQNYKLEKYDILKEIGMQAGNICKETMKQNVFSKAHSHDKKQELTIQKDKQHPPVGMGASK